MSLIPFISEPTPKSVCITLFFERHWLVQILLHYRCVVKVLIASGLKSERCWNSDIVWKFLTEQDDPQKTFAAFFWTDDWGQVKSFFGYVCLWVRTRIVCLWGRIKWQRKRYDFCLTPQACVPRGYTVKKSCSPFDSAAPGGVMPVSGLTSASFRQPMNTGIWDVTMTAKPVSSFIQAKSLWRGERITNEATGADFRQNSKY